MPLFCSCSYFLSSYIQSQCMLWFAPRCSLHTFEPSILKSYCAVFSSTPVKSIWENQMEERSNISFQLSKPKLSNYMQVVEYGESNFTTSDRGVTSGLAPHILCYNQAMTSDLTSRFDQDMTSGPTQRLLVWPYWAIIDQSVMFTFKQPVLSTIDPLVQVAVVASDR